MTLSDTATAQLLETFRASGGAELIREAVELVLQELIEAEATAAIGAAAMSAARPARRRATGTAAACWPPRPGSGAEDPQAAAGQLHAVGARAAPAYRQGAVRGDHGGLCRRGVDALGG